jgi:hypothetical protein
MLGILRKSPKGRPVAGDERLRTRQVGGGERVYACVPDAAPAFSRACRAS